MRPGQIGFSSCRNVTADGVPRAGASLSPVHGFGTHALTLASVPKPWTGDREAPVAEPGVRPRYDTCVDVSRP